MDRYPFLGVLLTMLLLWIIPNNAVAQESIKESQEQAFVQAKMLLRSFKNDSAAIILEQLVVDLQENEELSTVFGLKVQYRLAESLEKDHRDEAAIQQLIAIVEKSRTQESWGVNVNAHLSLARLYEKIDLWDQCIDNLRIAQSIIERHQINHLYPRFSVRMASFHRLHGVRDSAIFYAQEVLRTAPKYQLIEEEAVGHMLLGLLATVAEYEEAVAHFIAGGNTFRNTEDYSGWSYMLANVTKAHYRAGKYKKALAYSDSSLIAAAKSMAMGNDQDHVGYTALILRGKIYHELGQQDSAWYNTNLGYEQKIRNIQQNNLERVVEIDAQYQDEKKALLIKEQEVQLLQEKAKRNRAWMIISLVLIISSFLTYYYIRLRKANKKTIAQALEITEANEELSLSLKQQIMLQGEVHHRVKNNLQVIISLLELQKEDIEDPTAQKSLDTMSNRIYSMAAIHEILYQRQGSELVNLLDYAKNLCSHFSNFSKEQNKPIFKIDIDNSHFNLETLMPLGIILNELLTNSLKYASNLREQLVIGIQLKSLQDGFCISYRDNGPGFPSGSLIGREGGLGTYLLKSMSRQLSGRLETANDGGAVSHIYFKEKNKKLNT